jgi:uncharacterized protein (TIGR03435 family)
VAGADLKRRVHAIVRGSAGQRLGAAGRVLLAGAAAIAVALPVVTGVLVSQQGRTFEVVSIKRAAPGTDEKAFRLLPGATVRVRNSTLRSLILITYDLRDFQLSGGPSWVNTEPFDIDAKPDRPEGPSDFAKMTDEQGRAVEEHTRERLRAMLAERFGLSLRREEREQPVLVLSLAKERHYLRPSAPSDSPRQNIRAGVGRMRATHVTMEMLARSLAAEVERPVKDRTGLAGYYDFDLEWTPDASTDLPGALPSIYTALRDQLGLKLEAGRAPVEHFVIERAQRPSEN